VQAVALDAILGPVPHAVPTGAAFNEIAEVPFEVDPATGEFVLAFPIVPASAVWAPVLDFLAAH
jgi:hypothetical protein